MDMTSLGLAVATAACITAGWPRCLRSGWLRLAALASPRWPSQHRRNQGSLSEPEPVGAEPHAPAAHPPAPLPPQLPGPLTEASWWPNPLAWLSLYNAEGTSPWGQQGSPRATTEGVSGVETRLRDLRAEPPGLRFRLNNVHILGAVEGRQAQGQPGCM